VANVVGGFLDQVEALVRSQRLCDADSQPLRDRELSEFSGVAPYTSHSHTLFPSHTQG